MTNTMPTQGEIEQAIAVLREAGYAVTIWSDDDIKIMLGDVAKENNITVTEELEKRVVDTVKKSKYWSWLEEVDEYDFEVLADAVEFALDLG